jgi:hypothetical protein
MGQVSKSHGDGTQADVTDPGANHDAGEQNGGDDGRQGLRRAIIGETGGELRQ